MSLFPSSGLNWQDQERYSDEDIKKSFGGSVSSGEIFKKSPFGGKTYAESINVLKGGNGTTKLVEKKVQKEQPVADTFSSRVASGARTYRYPKSYMDDRRDYLEIRAIKHKYTGGLTPDYSSFTPLERSNEINKPGASQTQWYMYLPMPQDIIDNTSVAWNEDTINPIEAAGIGAGSDAMSNKWKKLQEDINKGTDKLSNLSQDDRNLFNNWVASQAVRAAGGNVSPQSVITRGNGKILQSNMELLFNGPRLRTFNFRWNFAPRDADESHEIKNIIRAIKIAMTPKRGGQTNGFFIDSPDYFKLNYKHRGNRPHPWMNQFKPCAMVAFDVNYTGSGTYATYADGAPVHTTISMSFQEVNPVYSEDFNTGKGSLGTGY